MARVLDDAARAKLLSSMIDRYDLDDDSGSNYPTTSTVPVPRDAPAGSENPNREDEQDMINQKMGRDPSNMQNMPRQQMVSVPVNLAHAGMQALMAQASGGRSMGADGAGRGADFNMDMRDVPGGFPRKPGDLEGGEMEADELAGHSRGPDFPSEEMDKQRATKQIRKRMGR